MDEPKKLNQNKWTTTSTKIEWEVLEKVKNQKRKAENQKKKKEEEKKHMSNIKDKKKKKKKTKEKKREEMAKEENTNTEYPLSYAQEVTWPFWSFSFVPGFLFYFLPNLER